MKVLSVNGGSSSLKFTLFDMPERVEIVNGYVEKIGLEDSFYTLKFNGEKVKKSLKINSHKDAVEVMLKELIDNNFIEDVNDIKGVGHRVLHGGEYYSEPTVIDSEVLDKIKSVVKFGPLHLPGEIAGIESMMEVMPNALQVAVFDTGFHQTMPDYNYIYPVPYEWYKENGVRKYGFHGTSHKYITNEMKNMLDKSDANLIICHVGSGASLAAIKDGKCLNTTMGLTPLDGVMMGTRSGSIDSSIIEYICKDRNLTVEEVNNILNKQSGLLGISGFSDHRDVEEAVKEGNEKAILANTMYVNKIANYIAQYYMELEGNVDALVLTAGLGENAINFRKELLEKLACFGIYLDEEANNNIAGYKEFRKGIITTSDSNIPVYVVPTNEELMIAIDTYNYL